MKIYLDGDRGKMIGEVWVAHNVLTIVVRSEDAKIPHLCPHCGKQTNIPYPSGYMMTLDIPLEQLKEVLHEKVNRLQGIQ